MKIVVLDGLLTARGDLSFDALRQFGALDYYENTLPEEAARRIGGAQAAIVNRTPLGRAQFERCPNLRYIGVTGTGYNIIDIAAAREHGVTVCNVPAYSTDAVAQMTFALLLEIARGTSLLAAHVRAGKWTDPLDPFVVAAPSFELNGRVLGIVGLGDIGRRVARIGAAFGMEVIGCRRPGAAAEGARPCAEARVCDFETVLRESDVLSIHCPLTGETRGLIGREALDRMKRGAVLLNTARGPILDEDAVAEALDSGRLYAAGVDVLAHEPARPGDRLARHPRCVATPHVAWAPRETRARLLGTLCENLRMYLAGTPQNVVS